MTPDEQPYVGYRDAHVLVVGASGFLGRWVARLLTSAGADLTLAVRDGASFERLMPAWGVLGRVVESDLGPTGSGLALVRSVEPDAVFNLAGYGVDRSERDEPALHRLNCELVFELAQALSSTPSRAWPGVRLVHAGSALEYGPMRSVLREDGPAEPHTAYGRSKLQGTLALHAASCATGLRAASARIFTVFGPGEHEGRLLPSLMAAATSGSSVELSSGDQVRDFAYAEDVAEGLLRIGRSSAGPGTCVNLATGRLISVREFAERAASVLGISRERLRFGAQPVRADEMRPGGVSVGRLDALIGWRPGDSIENGVARALAFDRAQRSLA